MPEPTTSTQITDEFMRAMLKARRSYTLVLLRGTSRADKEGDDKVIWEHGRRNFELRRDGKICIVGPTTDGSDVKGMYIFRTDTDETRTILEGDPAVQAGIFDYEMHPMSSFPGDCLLE